MIIVGLLVVKQFIAFMSELIGAANAFAEGDGLKGDLKGTMMKAGKMTLGSANIAKRFGGGAAKLIYKGVKRHIGKGKLEKLNQEINDIDTADNMDAAATRIEGLRKSYAAGGTNENDTEWSNEKKKLQARARVMGIDVNSDEYKQMENEALDEFLTKNNKAYKEDKDIVANGGYTKADQDKLTARQQLISANNFNMDGGDGVKRAAAQWARGLGGAFLKGLQEGLPDLGVNISKKDGLGRIFQSFTNNKLDGDGNVTGTFGGYQKEPGKTKAEKIAEKERLKQETGHGTFVRGLGHVGSFFKGVGTTVLSGGSNLMERGQAPTKPQSADDKMATSAQGMTQAAQQMSKAADAIVKAAERLNRYKP